MEEPRETRNKILCKAKNNSLGTCCKYILLEEEEKGEETAFPLRTSPTIWIITFLTLTYPTGHRNPRQKIELVEIEYSRVNLSIGEKRRAEQ